jgi:hypothetical protein
VNPNCLWRGILIVVLSVVLAKPAEAQSGKIVNTGAIVGGIVGVAAAVVVVTVVVLQRSSKKRTITGCVNSEENMMRVTDEKDNRSYSLSGNATGIKPGDRITLEGKKVKPKGADKTLVWEAKRVTKDFGACQP